MGECEKYQYRKVVNKINAKEPELEALSDS